MMHVIFAEGLQDDDYLARHTLGADQLRARVAEYAPAMVARTTGLSAERIVALAREYGRAKAAFVRINYGLQRHGGGGMAVRTIACLPAVTGHWRRAGGGVQLSTSANFRYNTAALERPDLSPAVRTINMIRLGDALTLPDAGVGGPPVQALVVYNSNPAAVAPDRNRVLTGLRREDLFTVVLEHFQTDTADFADYRAARHHAARALGCAPGVRAPLRHAQPAGHRADGRVQAEHPDLPRARRAHGAGRPLPRRGRLTRCCGRRWRRPTRRWRRSRTTR